MIKVLGINASPRGSSSRTNFLLGCCLNACRELGVQTEIIYLSNLYIEHCCGRYSEDRDSCHVENCIKTNDHFRFILNKMLFSDGIVFASPVQWFSVSSLMKVLIDRLTSAENKEKLFDGKVAGFIAIGEEDGAMMTILQMVSVFNFMGFVIPPYAFVYSTGYYDDISRDIEAIEDAKRLGKNLVLMINLLKENKVRWWSINR